MFVNSREILSRDDTMRRELVVVIVALAALAHASPSGETPFSIACLNLHFFTLCPLFHCRFAPTLTIACFVCRQGWKLNAVATSPDEAAMVAAWSQVVIYF